jgi:hypothetical protein
MRRIVLLLPCVLSLLPARAHAAEQKTRECTAAAESGQVLRNSGKLVQAKEQLALCMKLCPSIVKNDCGPWLNDVEARAASIVVRARDPSGREVTDVRVTVDGNVVATRIEALAIPIDPGARHLKFDRAGFPTAEQDLVVREGEKARTVEVRFTEPTRPAQDGTFPVAPVVLGGVGVAALGVFGIYYFSAKGDLDDMRATCAPRCTQDAVDAVDTKIFVSNLSLGIGLTALVAAAFVYLTTAPGGGSVRTGVARHPLVVQF